MKSKLLLSLILLLFAGRALCATAPPTLSLLQISGQTLSPAFDPNITSYTLTTTSGTPTVTLKPEVWVAANSGITITINGTKVASAAGTASPSFSVSDGNYISVVVTAPDGVTQQTYNVEINVNVLAPEMAALTSLSIVGQTLLSANGGPIDYSPNNPSGFISIVDYDSSSIQVEAVAGGTDQRITINGKSVAQGVASPPIPLKVGSNSIIISVTTPNGNGANYAITVTREPSSIATLKSVKIIGPGISATDTIGTTDGFNPTIPYAASSISLTAISTDTTANITISYHANFAGKGQAGTGAISLDVGPNVVSIIVTAQDGMTTKTYNFTFTRQPPSTSLNLLQISGETISPKFATNTTSYGSTVATSTTSVKVEAYTNDPNATLTVNGTTVASGAASQSIPLVFGANNIAVIVTGADKVSTQTYTISVTRPESSDATLALLLVGGQTISPTFSSAITSYTSTVPNTTTAVKIDAYCDPYATMTVNGTVTASGVASQSIPLVVGPNTITTTVTAQAGNTETYTIIITRLPSNRDALIIPCGRPNYIARL